MNWVQRDWKGLLALGFSGFFTAVAWPHLGEELPIHFNIHGVADGFASTPRAVALWLGILVGIHVLMTFLPRIDPFWQRIRERYDVILALRDVMLAILGVFYGFTLLAGVRGVWDPHWILFVYGALLIGLGNLLPRLPRNFFVGIRTPWTLASERIWRKTHQVGGVWMMGTGAVLILMGFLKAPPLWGFVLLLAVVIGTGILYPLVLYLRRKELPDL